jgi:hypothetical protein
MKGVVFTEFIELVEETYSMDMVDDIIDDCELASDGVFTSVGFYDYQEMVQLVGALSKRCNTPVADLLHVFGKHLIKKFSVNFSSMFEDNRDAFSFLESIDNHVHIEVRKLYPDAELPQLGATRPDPDTLIMRYKSNRPFAELAYGLICGAIDYFGEQIEVTREGESVDHKEQTFTLRKVS